MGAFSCAEKKGEERRLENHKGEGRLKEKRGFQLEKAKRQEVRVKGGTCLDRRRGETKGGGKRCRLMRLNTTKKGRGHCT